MDYKFTFNRLDSFTDPADYDRYLAWKGEEEDKSFGFMLGEAIQEKATQFELELGLQCNEPPARLSDIEIDTLVKAQTTLAGAKTMFTGLLDGLL